LSMQLSFVCDNLFLHRSLRSFPTRRSSDLQERGGASGDLLDGAVERLRVVGRGGAEPRNLADVLERCRPHVLVGHVLRVRGTKRLDAAAHTPSVTPASDVPTEPTRTRGRGAET